MKKKILCIVGNMNAGGAETFLMKIFRSLDKNEYQMDFYVNSVSKGFYEDEILRNGGVVFHSIPKSRNPIKSFYYLYKFVKKGNYDSVLRISQHSLSVIDLFVARFAGAKNTVFRSSNTNTGGNTLNQLLHLCFKPFIRFMCTGMVAPSKMAAEFMFGHKAYINGRVDIINNGIPITDFKYNEKNREERRKEFSLCNNIVIGHIGRFTNQKNHLFLIDFFKKLVLVNSNYRLLLVGKGELENAVKDYVSTLGLDEFVTFTGVRADVKELLSAFDLFVLPSHFEGLPNVIIEGQANGLTCLISNKITNEVALKENVHLIGISNEEADSWVKECLKKENLVRNNDNKVLYEKKYDIESVSNEFLRVLLRRSGEKNDR